LVSKRNGGSLGLFPDALIHIFALGVTDFNPTLLFCYRRQNIGINLWINGFSGFDNGVIHN